MCGETGGRGNRGDRDAPLAQHLAGSRNALAQKIGVRRHAGRGAEPPREMEAAVARHPRELVERQGAVEVCGDEVAHPAHAPGGDQHPLVGPCGGGLALVEPQQQRLERRFLLHDRHIVTRAGLDERGEHVPDQRIVTSDLLLQLHFRRVTFEALCHGLCEPAGLEIDMAEGDGPLGVPAVGASSGHGREAAAAHVALQRASALAACHLLVAAKVEDEVVVVQRRLVHEARAALPALDDRPADRARLGGQGARRCGPVPPRERVLRDLVGGVAKGMHGQRLIAKINPYKL